MNLVKPTPSAVVGVLALIVALSGTAVAATSSHINGSSIKKHSISGSKVKSNTLTGKQIKESTLSTVPKAASASNLGGLPASRYQHKEMYAYVGSDGTVEQQSGGITLIANNATSGEGYYLSVPVDVTGDILQVTPHYDESGDHEYYAEAATAVCTSTVTDAGGIVCDSGPNNGKEVYVGITDSSGADLTEGFYLTITTP